MRSILVPTALVVLITLCFIGAGVLWGYLQGVERRDTLTDRHLVDIVSVQQARLVGVLGSYIEEAQLVASRTRMRELVAEYNQAPREATAASIAKIIQDANRTTRTIQGIIIFGRSGTQITSAGNVTTATYPIDTNLSAAHIKGVRSEATKEQYVEVHAGLLLDGVRIGTVVVITSMAPLLEVVGDHTGLGETGELMLLAESEKGAIAYLTPLRFDPGAPFAQVITRVRTEDVAVQAFSGMPESRGVDYRGVSVRAVYEEVPSLPWVLVGKIDTQEEDAGVISIWTIALRVFALIALGVAGVAATIFFIVVRSVRRAVRSSETRTKEEEKFMEFLGIRQALSELRTLRTQIATLEEKKEDEFEQKFQERNAKIAKLEDELREAERLNTLMLDREEKMAALKKELNEYKKKSP